MKVLSGTMKPACPHTVKLSLVTLSTSQASDWPCRVVNALALPGVPRGSSSRRTWTLPLVYSVNLDASRVWASASGPPEMATTIVCSASSPRAAFGTTMPAASAAGVTPVMAGALVAAAAAGLAAAAVGAGAVVGAAAAGLGGVVGCGAAVGAAAGGGALQASSSAADENAPTR